MHWLHRRMLTFSSHVQVSPGCEANSGALGHLAGCQESLGQGPHTLSLWALPPGWGLASPTGKADFPSRAPLHQRPHHPETRESLWKVRLWPNRDLTPGCPFLFPNPSSPLASFTGSNNSFSLQVGELIAFCRCFFCTMARWSLRCGHNHHP